MPVYHFTYHASGTWLPDHPRGYTRRDTKVQPPDPHMADRYRSNMREDPAAFTAHIQRVLIAEIRTACDRQGYELRSVASDPTHLHLAVSWKSGKRWKQVRSGLQWSMSRRLNLAVKRRSWFVAHPSRKRVRDRKHLDYLVTEYHPSHRGWKWNPQRGYFK